MKSVKIPVQLKKMQEIFAKNGHKAYLVGGAVRDMLRGKDASDWDIATDATPQQVISMFHRVIPTGIAHGTVTVIFMGRHIEVTTFRSEKGYSDGRHPDYVEFGKNIDIDLSRRDFTMNAIAVSLGNGQIIDPFNGQLDIKNKLIRTVGRPEERFDEDGLRPIRAIRFATQLGFSIEDRTLTAIPSVLQRIESISIERFRDELEKIITSRMPSTALELMESTGILKIFIPELASCRGVEQADYRNIHQFDVLHHLFYSCDGAPQNKKLVRFAALFHDIGKPSCKNHEQRNGQNIITFYNHENKSAQICQELMTRLRFSKADTEYVCHLVKNHMFHYESNWSDAAVRRFLMRVKPQCIEDLFDLRLADVYGMTRISPQLKDGLWSQNLIELKDRIKQISQKEIALSVKDLAVNGTDLMAQGIPAGRMLGSILHELLETVLDDPNCNTKETLLKIAKNIAIQNNIT